ERLRASYARRSSATELLSLEEARARAFGTDWDEFEVVRPVHTEIQRWEEVPLADIVPFIDWSPFFWAWRLKGVYPKILKHPQYGQEASELYRDALGLLEQIVEEEAFH
ncbi:MAG: methionine synthase, partial [Opitutae bacterium]|nr:methionine synthase [Opitutae bacterium]